MKNQSIAGVAMEQGIELSKYWYLWKECEDYGKTAKET
jgi:hypothetical protein